MTAADPTPIVLGEPPGVQLHLLPLGATVHRVVVTCGDGVRRDVALGLPGPEELVASPHYVGGTIGRYANRIAHGRYRLDGRDVELPVNDRGHHLHGGPVGFDKQPWTVVERSTASAVLQLVSPDGDQGHPGELTVRARFDVAADTVEVGLAATTTAPTVVSLTNHAYFNLHGGGSADGHLLQVDADRYTPVDATGAPLGHLEPVAGTPFDFREPRELGPAIRADHEQVRAARGIDHNLVLSGSGWRRAATLVGPATATRMELWTDQPGLQVFTGNAFDGASVARSGALLRQGDGVALEPQRFPDAPNRPEWPSAVLRPGETYRSRIGWRFGPLR